MRFIDDMEQWLNACPWGMGSLLFAVFCVLAIFASLMLVWMTSGLVVWNG